MELISVIIPVYNAEKYLKKCIESVQMQTYEDIEIILVDDGSKDRSLQICNGFAEKDSRIRVIPKENGGAASARNKGLDVCKGEYIYFVDCDDYITVNALEVMMKHLHEKNVDMVVGGYSIVNENGEKLMHNSEAIKWRECLVSGNQFLVLNCTNEKAPLVYAWNKLYRKKIFSTLRYDIGKLHEDECIFHKICACCNSVAVIEDEVYFYLKRESSIMGTYNYNSGIDIFETYLDRIFYMEMEMKNSQEMQHAFVHTINVLFYSAFVYSRELGFDNANLNAQMKTLRKKVIKFVPIFWKYGSQNWKEKVACGLWLFSPRIYGKIWGDKNYGKR